MIIKSQIDNHREFVRIVALQSSLGAAKMIQEFSWKLHAIQF